MTKLFIFSFILTISCTLFATKIASNKAQPQPNIIVFLVDDMGLMDTSVPFLLGEDGKPQKYPLNEWYQTPNMEQLAEQGMRFNQFYAQSVCSPSRASILTGQDAARHHTTTWIKPTSNNRGQYGPKLWNWNGLTSTDITLPKLLRQHGYKTIHIGKGHFGPLTSEGANPENLGFEVNVGGSAWGRPNSYYGKNHYGNHPKYKKPHGELTHNIPHLAEYYQNDIFMTEALTLEANKHIALAAKEKKPFFLYMSHYAVHTPFESDERFAKHYKKQGKSSKAQAYATLVAGMDKSLGDIIANLTQLGIAENTLVLFLSDNGGDSPLGQTNEIASVAPLKGKKGTSWEGGMRVPFIAAWAKNNRNVLVQQLLPIAQGKVNTQVASILDIYPTILSLTNVASPTSHTFDGYPLKQQLAGKHNAQRPSSFLMHYPHSHRHSYFTSYRFNQWKLIYNYNPTQKEEVQLYQLYNLSNDISESNNLAKSNPKQLHTMMKMMIEELNLKQAQFPVDEVGNELYPQIPEISSL